MARRIWCGANTRACGFTTAKNHGWAYATNRGVELSTRSVFLFLNLDAYPTCVAVEAMRGRLRSSPHHRRHGPGAPQRGRNTPSLVRLWYWPTWLDIMKPTEAPALSAACMMTTRERFERVGAFDESFFLYNEELDWCRRARQAELQPGNRALYRVVHIGGGSTKRNPLLTLESWRGFGLPVRQALASLGHSRSCAKRCCGRGSCSSESIHAPATARCGRRWNP